MKYLLSGIIVGAVAVTAAVVIADHVRRQRRIEDVAELTDRLVQQLEDLEEQMSHGRASAAKSRKAPSATARARRPKALG